MGWYRSQSGGHNRTFNGNLLGESKIRMGLVVAPTGAFPSGFLLLLSAHLRLLPHRGQQVVPVWSRFRVGAATRVQSQSWSQQGQPAALGSGGFLIFHTWLCCVRRGQKSLFGLTVASGEQAVAIGDGSFLPRRKAFGGGGR